MKKPFKFRYVNEIVGIFVLLVVVVLIAGIIIAGRAQGWFEPIYEVRSIFPEEGSMGLRPGSEVRIQDAPAGVVHDIVPRDDGMLEGVFRIRGRFYTYVRDDSVAKVKRAFGVAGDAYLEITRGRGEPLSTDHPYIAIDKDAELTELIQQVVDEVRTATLPALEQLHLLLVEYTELAADLRAPDQPVQQLLTHLNEIARGLEEGEGPAGKLLRDPAMADELDVMMRRVNELLDDVGRIMVNVEQATHKLPDMADVLSDEVRDVPGLVYQTQATLAETEALLAGLQRHWLLRRYMDPKDEKTATPRIAPSVVIGAGRPE